MKIKFLPKSLYFNKSFLERIVLIIPTENSDGVVLYLEYNYKELKHLFERLKT